jgi:hypothetical protein
MEQRDYKILTRICDDLVFWFGHWSSYIKVQPMLVYFSAAAGGKTSVCFDVTSQHFMQSNKTSLLKDFHGNEMQDECKY